SPVAYYQQVGRAGRATTSADVLLLPGPEDRDIWRYFASASMPRQEQADAVLGALRGSAAPVSTAALETVVDIRRTRLELLLKVLDVEGAVSRATGGWTATGQDWVYDGERYARVAAAREHEQQLMLDYEHGPGCRMEFLQRALDDASAAPCGRCDRCTAPWYPSSMPDTAVLAARARLAQVGVELEPRAMWPTGMGRLGVPRRGRIGADEQAEPGRALARLTDLGWGQRLRELLRSPDPHPSAELVDACIEVLKGWGWARRPVAVAAIPSRSRPHLGPALAAELARVGRLEWLGTLDLVDGGPVGAAGGNSAFRLAGVFGRLAVPAGMASRLAAVGGPVLLVDDLAATRWTLTVAAAELRAHGAGAVLPFALALEA
ncbi:MAG TPA: hypothetical protein VHM65_00955, partial [Candidatus Lustribacter sp.]|nr:hypothetical protein [Candidatus Lustribacter sp.]